MGGISDGGTSDDATWRDKENDIYVCVYEYVYDHLLVTIRSIDAGASPSELLRKLVSVTSS